jgi:ATP-dependent Clp protease ATP-binding subunit ClpB
MELAGKFKEKEIHARVTEALRQHFLPEFLNRIDETIVFHPLGREELHEIVDLQLARLKKQLIENKFDLEVTDAAKDLLTQEGYDPQYGARPLKRVIQQRLQNTLANEILSGTFPEGSTILVDAQNGDFICTAK